MSQTNTINGKGGAVILHHEGNKNSFTDPWAMQHFEIGHIECPEEAHIKGRDKGQVPRRVEAKTGLFSVGRRGCPEHDYE